MGKVSNYVLQKANKVLNNLIGRSVFETFIFYQYCERYDIKIDSLEKFLYLYRDILKTDEYKVLYNDYYPLFEELTSAKDKKDKNKKREGVF